MSEFAGGIPLWMSKTGVNIKFAAFSLRVGLALCCVSAATGCVRVHATRCGYLSDYSQVQPVGSGGAQRLMAPDLQTFAQIDSIYVEQVQWLADDLGNPASSPERAERIRADFEMALVKELGAVRPIVQTIGPRTARVRAAITGVQEAKPFANAMCCGGMVGPLFNGGAVAEYEVLAPDGRQIAAESVAMRGRYWELTGYFYGPLHAEVAVKRMAHQLASHLDPAKPSGGSEWVPGSDGTGYFPGVATLTDRSRQ